MDTEDRKRLSDIRKLKYYSLRGKIEDMRYVLKDAYSDRGKSPAYIASMASLELLQKQVREDFSRYEKRIDTSSQKDEVALIQKALNRERLKRETLEAKIEEAKTSSGLFIKYVRGKLGV